MDSALKIPERIQARFIRALSGSFTPRNTIRPTVEALGIDYEQIKLEPFETIEQLDAVFDAIHTGSVVVIHNFDDLTLEQQQLLIDTINVRDDLDILVWHHFYAPWEVER